MCTGRSACRGRPSPASWACCVCLGLTLTLSNGTWIRLVVWTILGMSIYALYGFRNSRLRK